MKKLIIIGAGGHGRVIADAAEELNIYDNISFLDDAFPEFAINGQWHVIGKIDEFTKYPDAEFIVAFGNNKIRREMLNKLQQEKLHIASIFHPKASISKYCSIDVGVVILANAVVNIGSKIAAGTIINTSASVDHDCTLGECVHISPGVNLAGGVNVGELSWIGIGSNVIQYITVARNVQIAAGATVIKAQIDNALYMGVPAKFVRTLDNS